MRGLKQRTLVIPSVWPDQPQPHLYNHPVRQPGSAGGSLASAASSVLNPHWDSSQTSLVAPDHGASTALDLQDWLFHVLQQLIHEVDVRVGQLKPLNIGLDGS